MIYIINTIIAFDPVTRNLSLKNDAQLSVELSKPATRLLSELIEHNHTTLVREELIKRVWEDYGFSPSKGNLSNSISELRKAFTSLGLHQEIIITVPRTGFKMEAEIHPLVKYKKEATKVVIDTMEPVLDAPHLSMGSRLVSRLEKLENREKKQKIRLLLASSIGIAAIASIIFFMLPKSETLRLVTTIGMCNIYGLSNAKQPSDFVSNANDMIESQGIECMDEAADIYYADSRPVNSLLKVRFMAVCRNNGTARYQHCTTYKIVK
ncbi:winged helix-turn-helix domain-containing protein [Serratia fonticola]|uniref:winged helix-turn-helix domain-containing protein n=1 Tax=Serratia fonticola TaxID=47917 RepID=UPI002177C3B3|nr:winged helix-turn-helix domain-containing protein [Serratia fonticola]CAI1517035.1 DNA-binding transcriptional activator CadC [Serratia fonticola]CAI1840133.1 DNA-binding transcriptional activator CadC [Serratia fonticola]CAI2003760.1 DNA-binding transcriptional activator CadC [Serratia fonticola]